jgi:hypothetical protein
MALRALPPLLAFAAPTIMLVSAAAAQKLNFFDPSLWNRWDAAQYLSIATGGYQLVPCPKGGVYGPNDWCGNCGWFPGYSWIIAALARLHAPPVYAGLTASWVFNYGTLWIIWNKFLKSEWTVDNVAALAFAGFFPGYVFHHAVFPISMCAFFASLSIHLAVREKWLLSGLSGAASAFSYSTGFMLGPVLAVWMLIQYPPRSRRDLAPLAGRLAATAGLTVSGFALVLLVHRVTVGAWNAFFKIHEHYGQGLNNPVDAIVTHVRLAVTSEKHPLTSIQLLLFAVLVVGMVRATEVRNRLRERLDSALVIYLIVFWLVPLAAGGMVTNRSESTLMPCAYLLRNVPRTLQMFVIVAMVFIDWEMAGMFYKQTLI